MPELNKPLGDMSSNELGSVIRGKLLERNQGTIPFNLKLEQHEHSWNLLVIGQDNDGNETVGVAAQGPIGSIGVILSILGKAGAKPKMNPSTPIVKG